MVASRWNRGEVGQATLIGRGGNTDVTIMASGVPEDVTRPVHLYVYIHRGSCGQLQQQPDYSLTDHVLADVSWPMAFRNGPYTLRSTVAVPLEQLRGKPYAILVRSSPADGARELYCGDLG